MRHRHFAPLLLTVVVLVVTSGCAAPISSDEPGTTNQPTTSATAGTTTTTPPTTSPTSSTTPATTTTSTTVGTVAPLYANIPAGTTQQLDYRGRNITVSFTKSNGTSRVEVETGDHRRMITHNVSDRVTTADWAWKNLHFEITPVTAEYQDGNTAYVTAETWNTSQVKFEVYCTQNC